MNKEELCYRTKIIVDFVTTAADCGLLVIIEKIRAEITLLRMHILLQKHTKLWATTKTWLKLDDGTNEMLNAAIVNKIIVFYSGL